MTTQNTSPTPKHLYTPQFQLPEEFPLEEPLRRFKQLPDAEKERILRDFRYTKEWKRHCWGETFGAAQKYLCRIFGESLCRKISVDYRYDYEGKMFIKASFKSKNDRQIKKIFNMIYDDVELVSKYAPSCHGIEFSASASEDFSDVNDAIDWDIPKEGVSILDLLFYKEFEQRLLDFLADVFHRCAVRMERTWENVHGVKNHLDYVHCKIWHLDDDGKVILDFCER